MDDNPMILPVKEIEESKQIIATEKVDTVKPEAPVAIMTEQQKTEIPEPSKSF